MSLVLFGPPGAGKGTQSALLVERLNMQQISTGDLLRNSIKKQTDLGKLAQSYMDKGELVPDQVVIDMVNEVLKTGQDNIIFDGFPRTVAQAKALDDLLVQKNLSLRKAIFIKVPNKVLINRLSGRRVCSSCGAVFHIESKPTKVADKCDNCGGNVIQRNDDKVEVIENRLKVYDEFTSPLKNFYLAAGKYIEIEGELPTEEVYSKIKKVL